MPKVLTDLSEEALERAIVENMYAWTPLSHGWPNTELYTGKDVTWCLTDFSFSACNPIVKINMNTAEANHLLDMLIAKARKRKVNLQCWTTRNTSPSNMGDYLSSHGFITSGGTTGMAIDLMNMNGKNAAPSGFQIVDVTDDTTLKIWSHVTSTGFGFPENAEQEIFEWFKMDVKMKQPLSFFLGLLDSKPVATSMYYLAEGVVGVYWVATVPEARNKGIGFSITQKPLLDAKKLGYRVGILQASKMGKPVYLRLGFKEYSQIGSYSWIHELNKGDKDGQRIRQGK